MTDTNTLAPTDAEILDAAEDFRSQYTHGGTTFDEFDEIGFARAVLAKWGAPAQAVAEPSTAQAALAGATVPVPWLPYLSDRADGCKGHYAIARHNPAGYMEVWNLLSHTWAAFSEDVLTLGQATELLRNLVIPTAQQKTGVLEEAVAQAVAAEREACAQIAAQTVCDLHIPTGVKIYGAKAAKAIRARGTDAAKPAAQAQAVATIYVTEDGSREVDDWKVELPVGATTLYTSAQAATAKQSPHPEYDKGFSDGWNRCEERQAAAPAQAGEYPADTGNPEADRIIGRLASSDPDFDDCADAVALIHKLVAEIKGPDGYATWKDAAIAARAAPVDAASRPLTDSQIADIYFETLGQHLREQARKTVTRFARAIEAAHGIAAQQGDAA